MSIKQDIPIYDTDVLLIGAEAAGGYAAVKASEYDNVHVTVLTKGLDIGTSGATVTGSRSTFAFYARGLREKIGTDTDIRDGPDEFIEDTLREGKWVNEQNLVESYVYEGPDRAKEIEDWGFRWEKDDPNNFHASPGHSYRREIFGYKKTGPQMCTVFKNILARRPNVDVAGNMLALDLLTTEDGRVVGASALNIATGEMVVFRAKSVILATGGAQSLYPHVSLGRENTGDGHAMAYRAGAEFLDMQYIQFIPGVLLWPPGWYVGVQPFVMLYSVTWWYNRYGERFMRKWDPIRMEGTTRDIWSIAVGTEVIEGRGSEHGGIYASIKHLPDQMIDFYGRQMANKDWISSSNVDFKPLIEEMKEGLALEFGNYCHFWMGGIRINVDGETNLSGLYAAGECAGGVHGANRLSGGAFAQCIVQGNRAGISAAKNAREVGGHTPVNWEQVGATRERIYRPLELKDGLNPVEFRDRIQKMAMDKTGAVRDETMLRDCIEEVERLQKDEVPHLYSETKTLVYNQEWIWAIQNMNILETLPIVAYSALARPESRGAHYRRDFPITDNDNWLKHTIARKINGRCETHSEPIEFKLRTPPSGKRKYPGLTD